MENLNERELRWDDEIEKESEFILLDEGDYDFEVVSFERARHEGSEKLPPCPKAIIHIKIDTLQGPAIIKHNLFLHTKTEGLLSEFFKGIGQKKSGERIKMEWNKVIGSKGRCKISKDSYTKNNGEISERNNIKKFYEPTQPAQSVGSVTIQQKAFTLGKF